MGSCEQDLSGSGWAQLVGLNEHDNGPKGSIKENFLTS